MKVLYVYRSIKMGYSMDRVFRPIEAEMKKYCEVDSMEFDNTSYTLPSMIKNISRVRKYMRSHKDSLIHITGQEHYLLPFLQKYKTVITVHDLGFLSVIPKTFISKIKYKIKKWFWVDSLKYADRVVFISEKSMLEATKIVNLSNTKYSVIYNPVDKAYKTVDNAFNKERPRLLQIGTRPNKNLERVIEAINGLNVELRIIGSLTQVQTDLLNQNRIQYSQDQNISDEQMVREYQKSDIVIFASLYEGFGMPIVEGQACGKAVVTSNIEPMITVAGGAAVLVNPQDTASIRAGIIKAIDNYNDYIQSGTRNAELYKVENKAQEYLSVYNSFV